MAFKAIAGDLQITLGYEKATIGDHFAPAVHYARAGCEWGGSGAVPGLPPDCFGRSQGPATSQTGVEE